MDLPKNQFKASLLRGRQTFGLWSAMASPVAAEINAQAGFDWVLVDMEHGPNDIGSVLSQVQVLAAGPAPVLCRPAWNDPVLIKRVLDIGIQTLIIPMVQNAEEARAAVAATRYPPEGIRGVAGATRASGYGRVAGYLGAAAEEIALVVQIESAEAVANIDEIAAVEGVDALFVGPADLAASMGHLGNIGHEAVQAAMVEASERATGAGKPIGTLAVDPPVARNYEQMGFSFIAVGVDSLLYARITDALAAEFC
ncbi:MAG: HpcH/HpaI aldolase/citrate lyase family protein [Pseudomonadota bacterium]